MKSIPADKIQINYNDDAIWVRQPDSDANSLLRLSSLLKALEECGYTIIPPPSQLYNQIKEYMLGAWAKSCVTTDNGNRFDATNEHRRVLFTNYPGSTPFLEISDDQSIHFNGYLRDFADFRTVMELTSVQQPM